MDNIDKRGGFWNLLITLLAAVGLGSAGGGDPFGDQLRHCGVHGAWICRGPCEPDSHGAA